MALGQGREREGKEQQGGPGRREQGEGGGGREGGGEGRERHVLEGLVGCGEDLSFYLEGGGSPGGK